MAARAAIRDAGRAMGYSYAFCDQIAKLIPFNPTQGMKEGWLDETLKKVPELAALYESNADAKKLIDTARHLEGVARHASVHACATVIAKDALVERVPLQFAPQEKDIIITQFEMHAIEDLGLLKIDFLGLKNLTIIESTLRIIKELRGEDVNISQIPLDDKKTFQLLQRGDTTSVFQFESSGMRRYMKDLKPTQIEDLIALVALFRPGPMELIPTYINRKQGKEPIRYIHPIMEETLKTTYGVIVYQEQVMDLATKLAGLTRGEGYVLIKAVGKKIKSLLDEQKTKFIKGCIDNKIPQKVADQAWELIEPFARYGFNKAHSACYAMIGYRTAYLKANYPEEFTAAVLNSEMSDVERISVLIQEAKTAGVEILPPDINKSFVNFTPEGEKIRFGLLAIKNVGSEITKAIIEERSRNGPFKNFEDVLNRVQHKDLNKKSLESMAKSGVFESLGIERKQLLENMDEILKFTSALKKGTNGKGMNGGQSLFGDTALAPTITLKLKSVAPATNDEKLSWEKELIGFYLSEHPLNAYANKLTYYRARPIAELAAIKDEKKLVRTAGMVSKMKKIFTKSGQPMIFATIEDQHQQSVEVVVFNSVLEKTVAAWVVNTPVILDGRVSRRDNELKIICENAKRLEA
jgi:DNA polymerase-3 subunit alpha